MKATDEVKFTVKKGLPLPPTPLFGARSPLTEAMSRMAIGECIEFTDPKTQTFRSDLYVRARTAKIKIAIRTVQENGSKLLRVWRVE